MYNSTSVMVCIQQHLFEIRERMLRWGINATDSILIQKIDILNAQKDSIACSIVTLFNRFRKKSDPNRMFQSKISLETDLSPKKLGGIDFFSNNFFYQNPEMTLCLQIVSHQNFEHQQE